MSARTHSNKSWIEISAPAIRSNLRALGKVVGKKTSLMAVVKANAYGHGLEIASEIAVGAGAKWLGVDNLDEALRVKKVVKAAPILVLGYMPKSAIPAAIKAGVRFVVYDVDAVKAAAKCGRIARLHIKLETGTTRQGVGEKALLAVIAEAKRHPNVVIEGLSTHYANIEDTTDHSYAKSQLKEYVRLTRVAEEAYGHPIPVKHTACSAAMILFPETRFALARAGISMYGLWSSRETFVSAKERKVGLALKPALTWKALVAQVKDVPAGTPVSYGLTERVSRKSRIAVIPVGYSDGFDRGLSSVGSVLIRGKRAPVIGRVCMNMFMVDVTDIRGAKQEDEAVLIGRQGKETISAEDLASKTGTINYEIIARLSQSLPRTVVE